VPGDDVGRSSGGFGKAKHLAGLGGAEDDRGVGGHEDLSVPDRRERLKQGPDRARVDPVLGLLDEGHTGKPRQVGQ
jgi:hypothetical protein